jgi:hypothetical protein
MQAASATWDTFRTWPSNRDNVTPALSNALNGDAPVLRCVVAAAMLDNRNFGLPELSEISNSTQILLAKACVMLAEGVDEQVADQFAEKIRRTPSH